MKQLSNSMLSYGRGEVSKSVLQDNINETRIGLNGLFTKIKDINRDIPGCNYDNTQEEENYKSKL